MKIAISATGPTLDAEVDLRFGRCQYFVIADTETNGFEAIENSSAMAAGGAGVSAAQMVVERGVEAIITGNCGPNAHQVFSSAGIKVITGISGKIKDAIAEYKTGAYSASAQANVPDHYGMGGGRGMGRGMGMGGGFVSQSPPLQQPLSTEQEIETLKVQSKALAEQLDGIQQRIEELSNKRKDK